MIFREFQIIFKIEGLEFSSTYYNTMFCYITPLTIGNFYIENTMN